MFKYFLLFAAIIVLANVLGDVEDITTTLSAERILLGFVVLIIAGVLISKGKKEKFPPDNPEDTNNS